MTTRIIKAEFSDPSEIDGLTTALGDLIVGAGPTGLASLSVGANGQVLTADSAEPTGLKWETPSGGGGPIALGDLTDVVDNGATGTVLTFGGTVNDNFLFGQSAGASLPGFGAFSNTFIGTFVATGANTATTDKSTVIGNNIFDSNVVSISDSVAIGSDIQTPTASSGVADSVYIGHNMLGSGGTSLRNILIGRDIYMSGTSASFVDSVVIGNDAISTTNANGIRCVLIGQGVGNNMDRGEESIGIGFGALTDGSESVRGVAIGRNAGAGLRGSALFAQDNVMIGTDVCGNTSSGLGLQGSRNVMIGTEVGDNNLDTADSIGIGTNVFNNCGANGSTIAIGNGVYQRMFNGSGSIAIGDRAMQGLPPTSISTEDIAIGRLAMQTTDNTTNNVCIGRESMTTADGASNNIAIGSTVMPNVSGDSNIALGLQALNGITSGSFNVCLGQSSGSAITSGTENICIGRNSMSASVGGAVGNIVLGSGTASRLTGNDNVYIGSGILNTSSGDNGGNNNVAIGNVNVAQLNTGSNNSVIIGNNVNNNGVSNTIVIGNDGLVNAQGGILISADGGVVNSARDIQLGSEFTAATGARLWHRGQIVSNEAWIGGGTSGASIDNQGNIIRTPSDARLKENVNDLSFSTAELMKIRPRTFDYNEKYAERFGRSGVGFIAQELQNVIPGAVNRADIEIQAEDAEEREYALGVDAVKLIPYLVSCIQELNARISAIEGK